MENSYFLLFLLMSWLLCFTSSLAPTKTNSTTDQLTLLTIKNHITYDPRNILANNWSSTSSCCNWVGVTCRAGHARVTALNLSNMGLEGTIAPHMGNLSFLAALDLSINNFHGPLPQELGQLRRLKIINFTENSFSGELPSWFGNFSSLQRLVLAYNSFTGAIPSSIFNMSNLVELDWTSNFIQGDIPKEIGNCLKLELLKLRDNQLSGIIPSVIFNLSSLQLLSLANNSLSGSLPSNMCKNLSIIEILNLSWNKFHGQLPTNFEDCRKLQILSLSYNQLTGEIPNNVGSLNNLKQIFLGGNHLKGTIPPTVFNISSLEMISLSNNSLSGVLPMDICHKLPMLKVLHIYSTDLTGSIPKDIGNCSLLTIDMSENHLTDMVAHVGDFGIAKLLGESDFVTQTITMASIGYMAPEYGSEGIVSTKCDVYSYGILLMEVFTKKKPTDDMFTGEMSLKSWVNQSLPHSIVEVADTNLFGTTEEQFMIKKDCISSILELAMDCCAELPERRINMGDALTTLKKIKLKYLKDTYIRPTLENRRAN